MQTDDERLGLLLRKLRRSQGITQEALAKTARIPVAEIGRFENGGGAKLELGRIRKLFEHCDARARVAVWWQGAALDRLLDEEHALIAETAARSMAQYNWDTPMEVTFSEFGERGSIDIFGHRRDRLAVAVCEVKSAFGSLEDLNRSLDTKVRLAPKVCRDRFGWSPIHVARVLIVPEIGSIRRFVATHEQTMRSLYPATSRDVRAWLRSPESGMSGIWFVSGPRKPPGR
jgi:transcriptional regulator with XRE-family HTH domain